MFVYVSLISATSALTMFYSFHSHSEELPSLRKSSQILIACLSVTWQAKQPITDMMEKPGKNLTVLTKLTLSILSLSVHPLSDRVSTSQACPKASRTPVAECSRRQERRTSAALRARYSVTIPHARVDLLLNLGDKEADEGWGAAGKAETDAGLWKALARLTVNTKPIN